MPNNDIYDSMLYVSVWLKISLLSYKLMLQLPYRRTSIDAIHSFIPVLISNYVIDVHGGRGDKV